MKKTNDKAAAEKVEKLKKLKALIDAMSEAERQELVNKVGAILTCEGHACSITNTVYVLQQLETATIVGGYKQWQAQNRVVKKGEKAIYIFAPRVIKSTRTDEDLLRFSMVPVFDISQTEMIEA